MRISQVALSDLDPPGPDEIRVWTVHLDAETPTERRAQAKQALCTVLGACLGVAPTDVEFTELPNGKPVLPGREFEFNLTHSGEWAMFAVSRETPVGIDLERPRTFGSIDRFQRLVERICSEAERAAVAAAADPPDFLRRLWVRKEAVVKAEGVGVGAGERLPELDVLTDICDHVSLADLAAPAPGYHAAAGYLPRPY